MYTSLNDKLKLLPAEYPDELLASIREEFIKSGKTIVVLDDDPTGTQTCYDVVVLISWTVELIVAELKKNPSILFILTNSRSLPETDAVRLTMEIGRNLKEAVRQSAREIIVISRSDSTLRGHFPAEVDAVANALSMTDAGWILVPAFIEGGRFTIDDVHYIAEQGMLVPVADTPFAKDVVFGYKHSNLKEWVEEKTKGAVRVEDVVSIAIEDIRLGGPDAVIKKLKKCSAGKIGIVNAASYRDLEVFVMGVIGAEQSGQKFLYRTSATFVPIRAGMASGKIFSPKKENKFSSNGSLVVVGSHVPKTTSQLNYLLSQGKHKSIEIDVSEILNLKDTYAHLSSIIRQTEQWLLSGQDVVLHTSRKLETGKDSEANLKINAFVSEFLVDILKGLSTRPKFIIAKGGITSSDLASRGLSAKKALILGQVIPGVPVWRMDIESKFPEITYVVFPGNVGGETALADVITKLRG